MYDHMQDSNLIRLFTNEDTPNAVSETFNRKSFLGHTVQIVTDGPAVTIEGTLNGTDWSPLAPAQSANAFLFIQGAIRGMRATRDGTAGTVTAICMSHTSAYSN